MLLSSWGILAPAIKRERDSFSTSLQRAKCTGDSKRNPKCCGGTEEGGRAGDGSGRVSWPLWNSLSVSSKFTHYWLPASLLGLLSSAAFYCYFSFHLSVCFVSWTRFFATSTQQFFPFLPRTLMGIMGLTGESAGAVWFALFQNTIHKYPPKRTPSRSLFLIKIKYL